MLAHEANKMERNLIQISALTGWNENSRVPPKVFGLFRNISSISSWSFAFQLVELETLTKRKTPHDPHHCIGSNVWSHLSYELLWYKTYSVLLGTMGSHALSSPRLQKGRKRGGGGEEAWRRMAKKELLELGLRSCVEAMHCCTGQRSM